MATIKELSALDIIGLEFILKRKRNSKPIWLSVEVKVKGRKNISETYFMDARRPYRTETDAIKECKRLAKEMNIFKFILCRRYQGFPDRREEINIS